MLRNASRRLSALQPPPELPLAAQGGSSLLLPAALRVWSSDSRPPLHAAAPSSAAAAATATAAASVDVPALPQQPSSTPTYSSSWSSTQCSSSGGDEWQRRSMPVGSRAAGMLARSGALPPTAAAAARSSAMDGRRSLHWGSAAAAADDEEQRRTAKRMDQAAQSVMPELAVSRYLQERLRMRESEANQVVERIQSFGAPEAQCYRRVQPRVVSLEEVMPVVDFLLEELPGLDVAALVRQHPHILVDTSEGRMRGNCRQLVQELELSAQQLARIAKKCPYLLRTELERNVLPLFELLRGWGLTQAELRKLTVAFPNLFLYRAETIEGRLRWLHEQIGLSKNEVAQLLKKYPIVAVYSTAQHEQGRRWLLEQGVPHSLLSRAITRFPHILIYSEMKRGDWLDFVRKELGLSQAAVAKVLVAQPDMLGRSLELLRRHLGMWRDILHLSPAQLHSMLEANPAILRLDITSPTYAVKIDYLRGLLQGDQEAVAQVLSRHPYYLSYRLERIVTRGEYLRSLDRLPAESPTGWLSCTEPMFAVKFAKTSAVDFAAFKLRFMAGHEAARLLRSAEQERTHRMTEHQLTQERAAREAAQAGLERSLQQRIQVLMEKDVRLAAAETMLQQREEGLAAVAGEAEPRPAAADSGVALAAQQRPPEEQQAAPEQQQQQQQQQRKLPRLGTKLPDFSKGGWTAAAVRQRRGTLAVRIRDLQAALEGLAPAPGKRQQAAEGPS